MTNLERGPSFEQSLTMRVEQSSEPPLPKQEEPVAWRWQESGWGDYWVYNPEPEWLAEQNNIIKQPLYTRPSLDARMREALVSLQVWCDSPSTLNTRTE